MKAFIILFSLTTMALKERAGIPFLFKREIICFAFQSGLDSALLLPFTPNLKKAATNGTPGSGNTFTMYTYVAFNSFSNKTVNS